MFILNILERGKDGEKMNKIQQLFYLEKVFRNSCLNCDIDKESCEWRRTTSPYRQALLVIRNLYATPGGYFERFEKYVGGWVENDRMNCKERY